MSDPPTPCIPPPLGSCTPCSTSIWAIFLTDLPQEVWQQPSYLLYILPICIFTSMAQIYCFQNKIPALVVSTAYTY